MERSKRSFVVKKVREKINGGVERSSDGCHLGDCRVLDYLEGIKLRQLNRIKRSIAFIADVAVPSGEYLLHT